MPYNQSWKDSSIYRPRPPPNSTLSCPPSSIKLSKEKFELYDGKLCRLFRNLMNIYLLEWEAILAERNGEALRKL
jgi:hypothetical protein